MPKFIFLTTVLLSCLEASDSSDFIASAQTPILAAASRSKTNETSKNGVVPFGRLTFGATAAYGRIQLTEDNVLSSSILEPLIDNVLNTDKKSGGFGWRIFGNLLVEITPKVYIGPELGFSYYPEARYSQKIAFSFESSSGLIATYDIHSRGYGTDGLLNLTFFVVPEFAFSIRPGFQFAYQKNKVASRINVSTSSMSIPFTANPTYRNTGFLPEIILSAAWNFFDLRKNGWNKSDCALTAEITYQHIFGHDETGVNDRINSRDLFGLTLGVMF